MTAPGSSTRPRRWPASTARSPVSCRNRSPNTREARRICTFHCGATVEPAFAPVDGAENQLALLCDRGAARASAVDHVVRRALGQRLPALRPGLLRAGHGQLEPRQPQRGGPLAGGSRPGGHPDRIAHRRFGCQPVLVDRLGAGRGHRRAGGASAATAGRGRATCTARVLRCPNHWVRRSRWPPTTTPSSRSSVPIRCRTSPPSPAANGWSTSGQVSDWERKRYLARS